MLKENPTPWHDELRAISFDVQSTCADFYQPVLRAGAAINLSKALTINWAGLSAEWRDLYRATLDEVIEGKRPWMRVDRSTVDVAERTRFSRPSHSARA